MLRRHDEELQTLRQTRSAIQLSPSNYRANHDLEIGHTGENARNENACSDIGYKLKPDIFDGSVPLREFFS